MHNEPRLSLHIPEPAARPGDEPNFSGIQIPSAGSTPKPPVDADERSLRDMPYGLVRVLDDDGNAVGPWDPALEADTLRMALRAMMLTRAFDNRLFRVHLQGKTSLHMKSAGEDTRTSVALGKQL